MTLTIKKPSHTETQDVDSRAEAILAIEAVLEREYAKSVSLDEFDTVIEEFERNGRATYRDHWFDLA